MYIYIYIQIYNSTFYVNCIFMSTQIYICDTQHPVSAPQPSALRCFALRAHAPPAVLDMLMGSRLLHVSSEKKLGLKQIKTSHFHLWYRKNRRYNVSQFHHQQGHLLSQPSSRWAQEIPHFWEGVSSCFVRISNMNGEWHTSKQYLVRTNMDKNPVLNYSKFQSPSIRSINCSIYSHQKVNNIRRIIESAFITIRFIRLSVTTIQLICSYT